MSRCKDCDVTIADGMDMCPLCWHKLKNGESDQKKPYPQYSSELPVKSRLQKYKWFVFFSICVSVIVLLINLLTYNNSLWSLYIVASIAYAWLLLFHTILNRQHIGLRLLVQLIAASTLLVIIDLLSGAYLWSTNYAIPLLVMGGAVSINITVSTKEMRWPDYSIYQIITMFIGVVPLLIYLFGGATVLWPNLAAACVSFVIFVALLVFKDKKFRQELKKRFHA